MCRRGEQALSCDASAPSDARQFCTRWLGETIGSGASARRCVDAANLVVSELVTNAVQAGCARAEVVIDLHRERLRVGVTDDGAGMPQVQHPPSSHGHGRGLQIVERVSLSWGVSPGSARKLVWADLSVPAELTADLACSQPG